MSEQHICDCDDCNPMPFHDRCKYEAALLAVWEADPSMPDETWRLVRETLGKD